MDRLNITVTEFWVKPQGGGPAFQLDMVDTPVTVNLLELSVDNPAIFVDRANIPAGIYNYLEMKVDDSNSSVAHAMTHDGRMERVDIDVPSDRVRLINNFEVEPYTTVEENDGDDGIDPALFFLAPLSGDGTVRFDTAGDIAGPDFWSRPILKRRARPAFIKKAPCNHLGCKAPLTLFYSCGLLQFDLPQEVVTLDPSDLVVKFKDGLVCLVDVRLTVCLQELFITLPVRYDVVGAFHLDHE